MISTERCDHATTAGPTRGCRHCEYPPGPENLISKVTSVALEQKHMQPINKPEEPENDNEGCFLSDRKPDVQMSEPVMLGEGLFKCAVSSFEQQQTRLKSINM